MEGDTFLLRWEELVVTPLSGGGDDDRSTTKCGAQKHQEGGWGGAEKEDDLTLVEEDQERPREAGEQGEAAEALNPHPDPPEGRGRH